MPERLTYCPLLKEVTGGVEGRCSGQFPCSECLAFLELAPAGVQWVCSNCLDRYPSLVPLGFYATGTGAPWSDEPEGDVECDLCGDVRMILQAALEEDDDEG